MPKGKLFTIGELARAAEVPTLTVRYYEREGIVRPTGRSVSNYRLYGQAHVERLWFIGAA
jgi:DNA-binding transcriptional MerR regulator